METDYFKMATEGVNVFTNTTVNLIQLWSPFPRNSNISAMVLSLAHYSLRMSGCSKLRVNMRTDTDENLTVSVNKWRPKFCSIFHFRRYQKVADSIKNLT